VYGYEKVETNASKPIKQIYRKHSATTPCDKRRQHFRNFFFPQDLMLYPWVSGSCYSEGWWTLKMTWNDFRGDTVSHPKRMGWLTTQLLKSQNSHNKICY
jgi:hypothetical protein